MRIGLFSGTTGTVYIYRDNIRDKKQIHKESGREKLDSNGTSVQKSTEMKAAVLRI